MSAVPTVSPTRRRTTLAVLYAAFAAVAAGVNLGVQAVVLSLHGAVLLALVAGTVAGLPVKYALDKRYIFGFRTERLAQHGPLLARYTVMSGATTLIFWVVEWVTHRLTEDVALTLLGGAVGLLVGYVAKYHLDKRYVFVARPAGDQVADR